MSPVDSLGNYHPYYIVMPPNIDRKKFQLFRNYFLVQKDGVYAFGKKFDQVAIPSRFIHDNTPEETPF
ncbi:MAG: hypothetical protein LBG59_07265 [Candidatus Peribacteria bacterium]|jgi:hypothetical protein|nr:hypothetical protein [Candidatus Peribacteria bacterium]